MRTPGSGRRVCPGLLCVLLVVLVSSCAPPRAGPPPPARLPDVSTAAGYQELLTRTDRELADALAAVRNAPTVEELERSVLAAADVAGVAGEKLTTSGPVFPPVAEDNAALADGLYQFARELAFLSQQVNLQVICAGPTTYTAIGTAPSTPGLRAVAASLGTARPDRPAFRWGGALPPPVDAVETRLPNGAVPVDRRPPGTRGSGVLEVRNAGTADAVAVLAREGSALLSLAVSAGSSSRLEGIPDGDYQLYYTAGRDWVASSGTFSRYCEFHRLTGPTLFRSGPTDGEPARSVHNVTIGDATKDTDPAGFIEVAPSELPR